MTKAQIEAVDFLKNGGHEDQDGFCVMEAAAYIAGEPWSDAPMCVSPLLTRTMVSWNDSLGNDDETRTRLLTPLIPVILGTTAKHDAERSRMAWDWLARTYVPAWLDIVPSLQGHAKILRDCPIEDIIPKLMEARRASAAAGDAARAAAWAAAWAAARAAARDAAWAAAWAAARAAARDAARDAARAAAWAAAGAAAGDAARAAAGDAAWAKLAPTVKTLQESYADLIRKMAAIETREPVPFARTVRIDGFKFEKGATEAMPV